MKHDDDHVLNSKEICENYLGCSRAHLSKLVKDGGFPQPSFISPGVRGRMCWFYGVVKVWRAESLRLQMNGTGILDSAKKATVLATARNAEISSEVLAA